MKSRLCVEGTHVRVRGRADQVGAIWACEGKKGREEKGREEKA